jgi:hypothetical protein
LLLRTPLFWLLLVLLLRDCSAGCAFACFVLPPRCLVLSLVLVVCGSVCVCAVSALIHALAAVVCSACAR